MLVQRDGRLFNSCCGHGCSDHDVVCLLRTCDYTTINGVAKSSCSKCAHELVGTSQTCQLFLLHAQIHILFISTIFAYYSVPTAQTNQFPSTSSNVYNNIIIQKSLATRLSSSKCTRIHFEGNGTPKHPSNAAIIRHTTSPQGNPAHYPHRHDHYHVMSRVSGHRTTCIAEH